MSVIITAGNGVEFEVCGPHRAFNEQEAGDE